MKPDPMFMAFSDDASRESPTDVGLRPLDESVTAAESEVEDALSGDIEIPPGFTGPTLGGTEPVGYGSDLYAPTLRSNPLLSREEEETLGRIIQDSRAAMTENLARIPVAVETFIDLIMQSRARERPVTDALFSPFDSFSELSQAEADGAKMNWRHVAQLAEQLREEWRIVRGASASAQAREATRTRLSRFARGMQPGWVALREALRVCEALDEHVARMESEHGAFHADILNHAPRTAAHATLRRIEAEAGADLTTLRESHRAAASAYARYTSARDRMVNANLRLAYFMAHRLRGNNLSFDDLVQEAIIGLMRAVDKFDYRMGYKFSTYAVQWIRQSTTRAIADSSRTIRVAAHVHDDIVRLRRLARELEQNLGREPSSAELAKLSGTPESKVQHYLRLARQSVSLDAPPADIEDSPLSSIIPDAVGEDPHASTHDARLAESVAAILDALPEREAFILRLRHGVGGTEGHTLEEIGRMLGITRERTRQLEARAVKRLRETLDPELFRGLDD